MALLRDVVLAVIAFWLLWLIFKNGLIALFAAIFLLLLLAARAKSY